MEDYTVIDLETSIKNTGKMMKCGGKPSPHYEGNDIVLAGIKNGDDELVKTLLTPDTHFASGFGTKSILVGHNIAFDMHYLLTRCPHFVDHLKRKGNFILWDTMLVEYLLSGQEWKYPSLNDVAVKYGLPLKPDAIKKYWEAGIDTEDIPPDELREYLIHDVLVTEGIFLRQLTEIAHSGMRNLVADEMRARWATILMEHNGMAFSAAACSALRHLTKCDLAIAEKELDTQVHILHPELSPEYHINVGSSDQVSAILYGGTLTETIKEPIINEFGIEVRYKSGDKKGMIRYKNQEVEYKLRALVTPEIDQTFSTKKDGRCVYSSDVAFLERINSSSMRTKAFVERLAIEKMIKAIVEIRTLNKDINTYYDGVANTVWGDGLIHPQYNHTETATGRLSCRSPNLQNLTN